MDEYEKRYREHQADDQLQLFPFDRPQNDYSWFKYFLVAVILAIGILGFARVFWNVGI